MNKKKERRRKQEYHRDVRIWKEMLCMSIHVCMYVCMLCMFVRIQEKAKFLLLHANMHVLCITNNC